MASGVKVGVVTQPGVINARLKMTNDLGRQRAMHHIAIVIKLAVADSHAIRQCFKLRRDVS